MKKIYKIGFIVLIIFFSLYIFHLFYFKDKFVLAEDIELIREKIVPSPVIAKITRNCNIYREKERLNIIAALEQGEDVEILEDKGTEIYLVKSQTNNIKGWVLKDDLLIPETPPTSIDPIKNIEIESYINYIGLSSDTEYLIFVDIYRQLTYVLKGSFEKWKVVKIFSCGTGINESPTTRGIFKTSDKGEWFFSERLGSGAMYWIRFNGSYLFHSVAMDKNRQVIDDRIGERCSHGCVRLGLKDIEWLYNNIEAGTTVYIN